MPGTGGMVVAPAIGRRFSEKAQKRICAGFVCFDFHDIFRTCFLLRFFRKLAEGHDDQVTNIHLHISVISISPFLTPVPPLRLCGLCERHNTIA